MSVQTHALEITDGYRLHEKRFVTDIDSAVRILCSKKRRKITRAVRTDAEQAEMISNVIVCPACNKETPAYATFKNGCYEAPQDKKIQYSKADITAWGKSQLELFDDRREIFLNKIFLPEEDFYCPFCGKRSFAATKPKRVWIKESRDRLEISCEIVDFNGIFALSGAVKRNISLSLPMAETVVFNFLKGTTYIKISDEKGVVLCRDISEHPDVFKKCRVYSLLSNNKKLLRKVRHVFEEKWNGKLPFKRYELYPEKFLLLTRYIGFPPSFYTALPIECDKETYRIDRCFRKTAKKLHTVDDARQLYEASKLPDCKSIRKLFFEAPELLFYIEECEMLWEMIPDVNYFSEQIKRNTTYDLLVFLKKRPLCARFFMDYSEIKGKSATNKLLKNFDNIMKQCAIDYLSMSEEMKKREMLRIQKSKGALVFFDNRSDFSRPMAKPLQNIRECVIDGFKFVWMKNSNDYRIGAQKLKNCLGEWQWNDNPVVCVIKNGRYVAAIEVEDDTVIQARGVDNCSINKIRGLEGAFKKWRHRFSLQYEDEPFDFNNLFADDEDLPF